MVFVIPVMNNFRELNVWQKAIELGTKIYKVTYPYPKEEELQRD